MKNFQMLFLLLLTMTGCAYGFFDCRRDDPSCSGSGDCVWTTGLCTCTAATNTDFVCKVDRTDTTVVTPDCSLICGRGGVCYVDGGVEMCHCEAGFYGTRCENERAIVDCKGDRMSITLSPYTKPAKVYAFRSTDAGCVFSENAAGSGVYEFELMYDTTTNSCGDREPTNVEADVPNAGDKTYTNYVLVSYGIIESVIDDIYTIVCVVSADVNVQIQGDISQIAVDKKQDLMRGRAEGNYNGVLFELIDAGGTRITTAQLGSPISIRIYLRDTNVYQSMKVTSCSTMDTPTATATTNTMLLLENGCVKNTPPSSFVVRSGLSEGTHPLTNAPFVKFDLTVFKFTSGSTVYFMCEIQLCKTGDTTCQLDSSCPLAPGGVVRRRRSNVDQEGESSVVGALQVINALETTQENIFTDAQITDDCKLSDDILIIIIILGAALLILSILCIFIIMRYIRVMAQVKAKKYVNGCHSNSSSNPSHS